MAIGPTEYCGNGIPHLLPNGTKLQVPIYSSTYKVTKTNFKLVSVAACHADPAISTFYTVREVQSVERRIRQSQTLGKRKKALDNVTKKRIQAKVAEIMARSSSPLEGVPSSEEPESADTANHVAKKRRISADLGVGNSASTSPRKLTRTRMRDAVIS